MKTLFLSLVLAAYAAAQVNVTVTIPGEGGAQTVTFSSAFIQGIGPYIMGVPAQGIVVNNVGNVPNSGQITLTAPALAADTTFTLSNNFTGLLVGHGLLIGTEVCLVTNLSPLTVTRARIGTTAAAYPSGQAVTVLRSGSYGQFVRNSLADVAASVVANAGPLVAQQQAAVTAAQAAIVSAQAAAVSGSTK